MCIHACKNINTFMVPLEQNLASTHQRKKGKKQKQNSIPVTCIVYLSSNIYLLNKMYSNLGFLYVVRETTIKTDIKIHLYDQMFSTTTSATSLHRPNFFHPPNWANKGLNETLWPFKISLLRLNIKLLKGEIIIRPWLVVG